MYTFPNGVIPPKVFTIPLVGVDNYENRQKGSGIGLRYVRPSASLTAYLFTAGISKIPNNLLSPVVSNVLKNAIDDIKDAFTKGIYAAVDIEEPPFLEEDKKNDRAFFWVQRIKIKLHTNRIQESILLVGVLDNCFLKIRYSSDHVSDESYKMLLSEVIQRFNPLPTFPLSALRVNT